MNRREALAGIASLGALGTGGVIATTGLPSLGPGDDASPPQLEESTTVETFDLPWTDGEPVTVPQAGSVLLLEFWATWCSVCQAHLPKVTAAHEQVGDDVQFLSITSETVGPDAQVTVSDIEAWWREHGGGEWAIGYDPTVRLKTRLGALATPGYAVIDADGVTRWVDQGRVPTATLLEEIEGAGGTVDA
ncbi:TlpA family protein disulfide reductase [Halovivax limisalsi]|uniref:TlpA family protein disulfide reductase n=1 Tax=Halovivax limisalsi TaxID=1453760 RepID=UPI001FFD37C9|nr:TlpA disulfide reductase family protein [Halovivax limisalsi]